ncbi:glycoside hydrolase superfamily, partial [Microdochium bolleyi]
HFSDEAGRTIVLRGVNLADGKFPLGKPTYHLESLEGAESCSYINSFFTLPISSPSQHNSGRDVRGDTSDAHKHLTRLRYMGFNVLRVPVVWEALEHAGPGIYDDEYIEYIAALVKLCSSPPYNFRVIVNPHQDLWSRFVGGSGAPLWTLHACGLDERYFAETHACIRYAEWPPDEKDPAKKKPHEIPPMMWTTNHNRLASMTLFALFYGGRVVAPKCRLRYPGSGGDGDENIQDFLQRHYFAAYGRLMARLGDLPFAYDSMNEPEPGYIELKDLDRIEREDTAKIGSTPTPIQGMRMGMAMEQEVSEYRLGKTGPHKKGSVTIKPGRKCWLTQEDPRWEFVRGAEWPLGECLWALHGVWDSKTGELLQKDYFHKVMPYTSPVATKKENEQDGPLSFVSSYWQAFHQQWTATIRKHSRTAIAFIQPCVFSPPPPRENPQADDSLHEPRHDDAIPDTDGSRTNSTDEKHRLIAYSPHYYDGLTVMHRHWHERWNADVVGLLRGHHKTKVTGLRVGKDNVRKAIGGQLGLLASDAPDIPTLIGEMGIPFNLDDSKAYRKGVDPESGSLRNGECKGGGDTKGAGDYTEHVKALDAMFAGCDAHLLNYTLWAYSPINTHKWGDHWNGEDLSIY